MTRRRVVDDQIVVAAAPPLEDGAGKVLDHEVAGGYEPVEHRPGRRMARSMERLRNPRLRVANITVLGVPEGSVAGSPMA